MDIKEVFKGLLAIIVVGGAIASLFYTVNDTGEQLIQLLATGVVTFYFAKQTYPLAKARKPKTDE